MTGTGYAAALLAGVSSAALAAPVAETEVASPVSTISREDIEKLPSSKSIEDLLKTCPARTSPTVTKPPQPAPGGKGIAPPAINCIQPADLNVIEIYKAHNRARYEVGSRPLVWDPLLAAQAASYGPQLSLYGRPVHSSRAGRETSRENLLQALPGTSPAAMVGVWLAERQNFINGVFPDVSKTGNWADVGHYSQMVWPSTTNLGCAIHRGGQFDWLICRYSPPGNRDGKMVLAERDKEAPLPPPATGGLVHPGGAPAPIGPTTPPPPKPPPNATDEAPSYGGEFAHPLRVYFDQALDEYVNWPVHDMSVSPLGRELALRKMRYAYDEMVKRWKAAKAAGKFSSVDPKEVKKILDYMRDELRRALQPPRAQ